MIGKCTRCGWEGEVREAGASRRVVCSSCFQRGERPTEPAAMKEESKPLPPLEGDECPF